ncbi:hypothetical protein F4774DRAFT_365150 [Daldinia eschscholtzii]|nr:hypothetical protein F4774DRAFT_365150 [Daldinia eschscholtzii]
MIRWPNMMGSSSCSLLWLVSPLYFGVGRKFDPLCLDPGGLNSPLPIVSFRFVYDIGNGRFDQALLSDAGSTGAYLND